MTGEFEKLAYEAALRSLDKQERLLEELRARTGVLLAASSVAITLLGLAYLLDGFWEINEQTIARLAIAYVVAATALVVEILALVTLLGSSIV